MVYLNHDGANFSVNNRVKKVQMSFYLNLFYGSDLMSVSFL